MRIPRVTVPVVLEEYDYQFELGKAQMIRDGADVVFISTGLMTTRAILAAKRLEDESIHCAVLHVPTIKPLDTTAVLEACQKPGRLVVVAENHSVIGGIGESVATTLVTNNVAPAAFRQIGLPDVFLDAGTLPTLHNRYGLSVEEVCRSVKGWLE